MDEARLIRFPIMCQGLQIIVVTHEALHGDEIFAATLVERYGSLEFLEQYAKDDTILLGVGAGEFDEHPSITDGTPRKEDDCCASLVAKALGVELEPNVRQAIKYVFKADQGHDVDFGICTVVKVMHQQNLDDPQVARRWARLGFMAKLDDCGANKDFSLQGITASMSVTSGFAQAMKWFRQGFDLMVREHMAFHTTTKAEFEAKAHVSQIPGPNGRTLTLVVIETDDTRMGKYARHSAKADFVVTRRSTGHTQIVGNQRTGIHVRDVAMMIRVEELRARGSDIVPSWGQLVAEDAYEGDPWHMLPNGSILLNGSATNTRVSPTLLPLDRIVQLVTLGVDPTAFEMTRQGWCQDGRCVSTPEAGCPWYDYGLPRCRAVRAGQYAETHDAPRGHASVNDD